MEFSVGKAGLSWHPGGPIWNGGVTTKLKVAVAHWEVARGGNVMMRHWWLHYCYRTIYTMSYLATKQCSGLLLQATMKLFVATTCRKVHRSGTIAVTSNEEDDRHDGGATKA